MTHRHTWGTKTRQPRPGDLCLTCPATWAARGRGEQYMASDYKPRTVPMRIVKAQPVEAE